MFSIDFCHVRENVDWLILIEIQLVALKSHDKPDNIILACNTHLYFHPQADILRCLQVIIGLERIHEIKQFYENEVNIGTELNSQTSMKIFNFHSGQNSFNHLGWWFQCQCHIIELSASRQWSNGVR